MSVEEKTKQKPINPEVDLAREFVQRASKEAGSFRAWLGGSVRPNHSERLRAEILDWLLEVYPEQRITPALISRIETFARLLALKDTAK